MSYLNSEATVRRLTPRHRHRWLRGVAITTAAVLATGGVLASTAAASQAASPAAQQSKSSAAKLAAAQPGLPSQVSKARAKPTPGDNSPPWNGLALTPPMGYNNWSYYQCDISENTILTQARALVSKGLAKKGYDTVTTDDCWMTKTRAADGSLVADPVTFPHGMAWLGAQLHALGLKFGIYEDAGTTTCGGFAGSWDHFDQDAQTFANWKVDYIKLDGCNLPDVAGQSMEQTYRSAYSQFSDGIIKSGRKMVYSESAPAYFQGGPDWNTVLGWVAKYGNLWREGADIALGQASGAAQWDSLNYNYEYNVGLGQYAGSGHWNDPDFLLVGNPQLSVDEMQSQMALWSMMAAPLISSTDLTAASPAALKILGNTDVIAVDQDPAGVQANIVQQNASYDVLSKPLANGEYAVALYNKADTAQTITTTASAVGLTPRSSFSLTNLVSKAVTQTNGNIAANVAPHGTAIYRVHPGAAAGTQPSTVITVSGTAPKPGATSTYTVGLTDNGATKLTAVQLSFAAPKGWTVTRTSNTPTTVKPGNTAVTKYKVTAPVGDKPGKTVSTLTATALYQAGKAGAGAVSGAGTVVTNTPYATLADAFNGVAISDESNPTPGNFDGDGDSYSAQALAKLGVTPGSTFSHDGISFSWPSSAAGTKDNVEAAGQLVTLSGKGSALGLLGSEAGDNSGPLTVTYTDGTTSTATIGFPNWCCSDPTEFGATPVIVTDHRNTPTGPANFGNDYDVFYISVPLDATKTVASITMPNQAAIHVFAVAVKP